MEALAETREDVNATIWLVKGEHFLFHCQELKDQPELETSKRKQSEDEEVRHRPLCSIPSLQQAYPKTDNINLVIRSLMCDSHEAQNLDKAIFDPRWFYSVCSTITPEHDHRAVIYVNIPEYYFNITKSSVFKDVIFDGINQFGTISFREEAEPAQTPNGGQGATAEKGRTNDNDKKITSSGKNAKEESLPEMGETASK